MMTRHAFIALLLVATSTWVAAQAPPPKEATANDTLEPAVDTSAPIEPEKAAKPNEPAAASPSSASASAKPAPAQPGARSGKAQDRLELDTTQITGNRELPKVLYIVPWKRSDLGDLLGRPVNSLLDEVLAPVDRDVFKRENRYYSALQPEAAAAAPSSAPAPPPAHP